MPESVMLPTQGSGTAQGVPCKGAPNDLCPGGMNCYAEGTPQVACISQGMLGMLGAATPMGGGSKPVAPFIAATPAQTSGAVGELPYIAILPLRVPRRVP